MGSSLFPYLLISAVFLCQALILPVSCFRFNFSTFLKEDEKQLILSTNSYIVLGAIQVTPDVNGGSMQNYSGRALYKKPFRLWKDNRTSIASFNTTFVLNILNQTSRGGEGVAFILTGNSSLPNNSQGQWLGIVNANSNGSTRASVVAVEFDTRKNDDQDLDGNHIGLNINSMDSIRQVSLSNYGINISGGRDLRVTLRYHGETLRVYIGENETLVLSQPIDLSTYLPEKVFVGFSGSTSNETELNCVKSWSFAGLNIGGDRNLGWVWITVPVATLVVLVAVGICLCLRRVTQEGDLEGVQGNIEDEITRSSLGPRKFRLKELKQATNNFSPKNKLGKGGFGTVYRGTWRNNDVAVKRVSKKSHQGKQEFVAEVTTIGNLNHRNLVKLIGWCYEKRELLLVYDYMPNGSLDKFIFFHDKAAKQEESTVLNWEQRLTIVQGVAQALDYLHNGSQNRVLHRDIKSSNIMLDSEFNARLGDFGLARTIRGKGKTHHSTIEVAGTPGYMAPETFLIGRATVETDVYSFGVFVMEVVCGRKPGNQSELNNYNNSIVNWVWDCYRKGSMSGAADSRMEGNLDEKEVECVLVLGLGCCHPNPHYRPSMRTVVQVLSGEADPPQVPQERPSFVWPAMPPSFSEMGYSLTGSQLTPFTELSGR
ncbi:L-type lectin receptor kinase S.5 [Hibiscus trionum]|uniref:non-specific serine/threonine protein kinase n=1 Tax=Hibiscus trionum TaxID=183268 RepID=A0A9W7H502_HIBTR|nr:L-type lectin receptor kinase S.5 [Hibiscus trionum]